MGSPEIDMRSQRKKEKGEGGKKKKKKEDHQRSHQVTDIQKSIHTLTGF